MGIGAPSLYAAFGSKAKLFIEATELYLCEDFGEPTRLLSEGETARSSVEALLRANADLFTQPGEPAGCMLTRAVSTCLDDDPELTAYLAGTVEQRIRDVEVRLERGVAEGEQLPCVDIRALAEYIDAVAEGMAVRSMEGASRDALHRIVDIAMRIWDVG
jgi:TetR/AcrR family transcriptional regulator, copper-responsive repressor